MSVFYYEKVDEFENMPYFCQNRGWPEPGISGLEKRAPSGELEFFSRSN